MSLMAPAYSQGGPQATRSRCKYWDSQLQTPKNLPKRR